MFRQVNQDDDAIIVKEMDKSRLETTFRTHPGRVTRTRHCQVPFRRFPIRNADPVIENSD